MLTFECYSNGFATSSWENSWVITVWVNVWYLNCQRLFFWRYRPKPRGAQKTETFERRNSASKPSFPVSVRVLCYGDRKVGNSSEQVALSCASIISHVIVDISNPLHQHPPCASSPLLPCVNPPTGPPQWQRRGPSTPEMNRHSSQSSKRNVWQFIHSIWEEFSLVAGLDTPLCRPLPPRGLKTWCVLTTRVLVPQKINSELWHACATIDAAVVFGGDNPVSSSPGCR